MAIADKTGRSKRTVLAWTRRDPPCPHKLIEGSKGPELRFRIDQVRGWMRDQGLDGRDPAGVPSKSSAGQAKSAKTPKKPTKPPAPRRAKKTPPAQDSSTAIGPSGFVGLDFLVEEVDQAIRQLFDEDHKPPADASPAAKRLWVSSFKDASAEFRRLLKDVNAAKKESGDWIPRHEALRILGEFAQIIRSDMEALAADLPTTIGHALADAGPTASGAAIERMMTAAVKEAIDDRRARIAQQLTAGQNDLGRDGGKSGNR